MFQQDAEGFRLADRHHFLDGSEEMLLSQSFVRDPCDQGPDDLLMSIDGGQGQRGGPLPAKVHFGASREQRADKIGVTLFRRYHESGLPRVGVGAIQRRTLTNEG